MKPLALAAEIAFGRALRGTGASCIPVLGFTNPTCEIGGGSAP